MVQRKVRAPTREPELPASALERARAGSRADREALIVRYQGAVFALLSRMLIPKGRAGQVADLAQETFVRVLGALPGFDPHGPARLSTWILTIATRIALDELGRPRVVTEPLEYARGVGDDTGERAAEQGALRRAIVKALATLEPDHQAVIVLREYHDLDYLEIAGALELDVGTVKSRLARARQALRRALEGNK